MKFSHEEVQNSIPRKTQQSQQDYVLLSVSFAFVAAEAAAVALEGDVVKVSEDCNDYVECHFGRAACC